MREIINIDKWSRQKAYKIFINYGDPYTGVTTTLNITNLVNLSKATNNFFTELCYILY